MSVTVCEHHGKVGADQICSHLAANRIDVSPLKLKVIRCIQVVMDDDSTERMRLSLFYCGKCVEEYGFPSENSEISDQRFNDMERIGPFTGVCYLCFRNLYNL